MYALCTDPTTVRVSEKRNPFKSQLLFLLGANEFQQFKNRHSLRSLSREIKRTNVNFITCAMCEFPAALCYNDNDSFGNKLA